MAAFGINAICNSTDTSDFHEVGYGTQRIGSSAIFIAYNDNKTTRVLTLNGGGDLFLGPGSASFLSQAAQGGFLYVRGMNGAPSGTPTIAANGHVALAYDQANDKLYAYNGGWVGVTLS